MEVLIPAAILGITVGIIACAKGYSFFWWSIFGAFLFIVAFPWVLCLGSKRIKRCPKCAELVKGAAIICKFCGHEFYIEPIDKSWGAIDE